MRTNLNVKKGFVGVAVAALAFASVAYADRPAEEEYREAVPMEEAMPAKPLPESCGWNTRLSAGTPVWFFDEEDNEVAPGIYLDAWDCNVPLNYRVGVEFRHLDLEQENAAGLGETPGADPEVTFVKIPFAVEYYQELSDDLTWFIGLGPDILNLANDISDTSVGMHISTRVHYAFNEHWGASLDWGYMWGDLDGDNGDIEMDHWFLTPAIAYTF